MINTKAIINRLKVELNDSKNQILEMQEMYDEVLTWTELYPPNIQFQKCHVIVRG